MNRNRAREVEPAQRLRPLCFQFFPFLRSGVFAIFGIALVVHSQSVPPPDPELNSADAQMSAFEKVLKIDRSDSAARKSEVDAAVRFSLAEKREHRDQAALWLLLRARYWVPDDPDLLTDLGVQEDYSEATWYGSRGAIPSAQAANSGFRISLRASRETRLEHTTSITLTRRRTTEETQPIRNRTQG